MATAAKKKGKIKKSLTSGIVNIKATFNNTIVTVSDSNGETYSWASGGVCGFKGSRKSTPFAAQKAMEKAMQAATSMGLKTVTVRVKGPGAGRDPAIKAIANFPEVTVTGIKDVTPLPHNGCKPPKRRSV